MLFSRKKNDQETVPAVDAAPDSTPAIEITGSLATAIDGVDAVLATKRQVQGAVSTARQEIATFDAELAAARERLATVEAQAAMGGESDTKSARRNLLSLRDQREFAEAKLTGLLAREREADAAVAEAQRVLADEWGAWASQQVAALRARYDRAVGAFLDEVAVVMAGALVLGSSASRLTAITRGITIPHTTDPLEELRQPDVHQRPRCRRRPRTGRTYRCGGGARDAPDPRLRGRTERYGERRCGPAG